MKKNSFLKLKKTSKIQNCIKQSRQTQTIKKRSFLRFNKPSHNIKQSQIHQIILNLQRNVKDLKKYQHQVSLRKMRGTYSCNNVNNFGEISKTLKKVKSLKKVLTQTHNQINRQSVCKSGYGYQNGSTMISIHSGDIQQIKKAYFNTYGRYNSNIVQLYNFYRKNIQKSTRILGSMQISNYPQFQLSLVKQQSGNKPSERRLNNVIVQINNQKNKQNLRHNQGYNNNNNNKHQKNFIQQIFSRGSSDLVNAGQIIRKRPLSGYFKRNVNNQKSKLDKNQKLRIGQLIQKSNQKSKSFCQKLQTKHTIQKNQCLLTPKVCEKGQQNRHSMLKSLKKKTEQKKSQGKYLQISHSKQTYNKLSQKSSNKSSNKRSSKKKSLLDKRIDEFSLSEISQIKDIQQNTKNRQKQVRIFSLLPEKEHQNVQKYNSLQIQQIKIQKFKKSKYYVSPVPLVKKNSNQLQDCSISFKSSLRIIQLDFIPLDL